MPLHAPHEQAITRPLPRDDLVQRRRVAAQAGALLVWVDTDVTCRAPPDGQPGWPAVFSDAAIQFSLSIKVLFKLPLRQTAGVVASLLELGGTGRYRNFPPCAAGRRPWPCMFPIVGQMAR